VAKQRKSQTASKSSTSHGRGASSQPASDSALSQSLPAVGCWINIFDPIVGELVGPCGYTHAMIDMEHSPVALESTLAMIRAVQAGGAKAYVRVPEKDPAWVGRLMDLGANGVMVPMVNSVREAQDLLSAAIYAPNGTRGMAAPISRASVYGIHTDEYLSNYRKHFTLMLQIETAQAADACEDIALLDGVDALFIGPYDLSGSLGNTAQPEHKKTRAAIRKIMKSVKAAGKPISTLTYPSKSASKLFSEGFDLVFSGSDLGMLRTALMSDASKSQAIIKKLSGR